VREVKKFSGNISKPMSFASPIYIYSEYCSYCADFTKKLGEHPQLAKELVALNIDYIPGTRQRPREFYQVQEALRVKIAEVPTLVVDNGKTILSGEDAFMWLNQQKQQEQQPQEALPYIPLEMTGFSDGYAKYGSTEMHDASAQSFAFLGTPSSTIATPQEESDAGERNNAGGGFATTSMRTERVQRQKDFDTKFQELVNKRDQMLPSAGPPPMVNFASGKM
jgi:hypothetical protein